MVPQGNSPARPPLPAAAPRAWFRIPARASCLRFRGPNPCVAEQDRPRSPKSSRTHHKWLGKDTGGARVSGRQTCGGDFVNVNVLAVAGAVPWPPEFCDIGVT